MNARKRIFLLILIMVTSSLFVAGIAIVMLYGTAYGEQKDRLIETVRSQARLVEAIARFNAVNNKDYPAGPLTATLSQIIEAHINYKHSGKTTDFSLAQKAADKMIFLLKHRHGEEDPEYHDLNTVSVNSKLAEPMRQALLGHSGTVVGLDYRGEKVLAAYEPLAGLNWGIVAKTNLASVRAPFVKTGLLAILITGLFVSAGTALFFRISNPMIQLLEKRAVELTKLNLNLNQEIDERKRAERELQKAHNELEIRVEERTKELSKANLLLNEEMNERKRVEKQLQKSKSMLQKVFDGISEPLILLDSDLTVKMLNTAASKYYRAEYQQVIGKPCHQAFNARSNPCEGCDIPSVIETSTKVTFERNSLIRPERLEQVVVYPIKEKNSKTPTVIVRISDITEARFLEEKLIQSEKLASLGLLVAGIAHEINNPNNFITFNIPIMRDYIGHLIKIADEYAEEQKDFELFNMPYLDFREDIFNLLENIKHGSERIKSIVSDLSEFSRMKSKKAMVYTELSPIIEKAITICEGKIKRKAKSLEVNIPENLPLVYTDQLFLEQALIILLINAFQALDKDVSWVKLRVNHGDKWKDHLMIEVSDNGCGMDEETRKNIFNPLFTTKGPKEGTGLGLYVCHNLIEELGGRIDVWSEVAKGSTFRVILPDKDRIHKKRF
jgi:C4-dicarboxylate-specific signal transduction histidine kinase